MMGNELFSVSRLLFCCADIYMLYRFFSAIFKKKRGVKITITCTVIITLAVFLENSIGLTWLNLITIPVIYYFYVVLVFDISLSNGIAYTLIFYVIFAAGKEVSFEILYRLLSNILPFYIPPWFTSGGVYFLLIEYIVGFLLLIYSEKYTKKIKISNNNNFSWYLLIVPIFSMFISINFLYLDFPSSKILQILMCSGAFLLFFTNIAIFIILEKYTDVMNKVKYAELYSMKRDMENEHFQNILKINDRYRCFIHDINSYFNSFRFLALNDDNKKIVSIIDELKGKIQEETSSILYSSHPVFNAILSERVTKAKDIGVEFSLFIEKNLNLDFINDADMISMFGNLLDNAVEGAVKCKPENRKVDVKLFMGTNYFLIFHIKNSYAILAKKDGNRRLSTKEVSQSHGLGIGIVTNLAEKYGGTLNLEERSDLFTTTLTISTYSEKQNANFGTQRV